MAIELDTWLETYRRAWEDKDSNEAAAFSPKTPPTDPTSSRILTRAGKVSSPTGLL